MDRSPRLVLVALLLVAVPAAAAGVPGVNVTAGTDDPATVTGSSPDGVGDGPGSDGVTYVDRSRTDGRAAAPVSGQARGSVPGAVDNGTPARLRLDSANVRSGYGTPRLDLSATVGIGDGELQSGYGMYWYTYRVERAENASERDRLIAAALTHAESRLESLRDREATAIRSYHNGTASTRDLLAELARIDAQAATIRRSLEKLNRYPDVGRSLRTRIQNTNRGLESLEGPTRDRIRAGLNGEDEDVVVHVMASENGVVVETIADQEYHREAIRLDHHDPDRAGNSGVIRQRMSELYPETFSPEPFRGWGWAPTNEEGLFQVNFFTQQGSATLYLDTGTNQVYREQQVLQLSRLPRNRVASKTSGGITVTVDRVDGGNPIAINVTAIGSSVDAIVRVGDDRLGRTGENGQLWTVAPPGEYTITVVSPGEVINVTVPADGAVEAAPREAVDRDPSPSRFRPDLYTRVGDQPGA